MAKASSNLANLRLSQFDSMDLGFDFTTPVKMISIIPAMQFFPQSIGYGRLDYLIDLISSKCGGELVPDNTYTVSNAGVQSVLDLLKALNLMVDQTPPLEGPKRFGNMAFRTWHTKLRAASEKLILDSFKDNHLAVGAEVELNAYLTNAFGSLQRLDFGTGHELTFLAFVGGFYFLKTIGEPTGEEWLLIFSQYLKLIQRLITIYDLEPAGSHGVWGLDDHFHLPYIFGSAQFLDFSLNTSSDPIPLPSAPTPASTLDPKTIQTYAAGNLYFNCLQYIRQVKRGPFHEHSPMLFDISGVINWFKVHRGMRKMYMAEVLGKFPVVQHFLFGNVLFPWRDLQNNEKLPILGLDESEDDSTNDEIRLRCLNSDFQRSTGIIRSPVGVSIASVPATRAPAYDPHVVTKVPWAR